MKTNMRFATAVMQILVLLAIAIGGCGKADATKKLTQSSKSGDSVGVVDEEATIRELVESYFLAPANKRRDLVLDAPNLDEQMEKYYKGRPPIAKTVSVVVDELRPVGNNAFLVYSTVKRPQETRNLRCYVKKQNERWGIDWHATVGFNPVSLRTLRTTSPRGDSVVRVHAQLSDYYNYQYRVAKNSHFSIELTDAHDESIHGFVKKESQIGKDIFNTIEDGHPHEIAVTLRGTGDEGSVVEIVGFPSKTWIID